VRREPWRRKMRPTTDVKSTAVRKEEMAVHLKEGAMWHVDPLLTPVVMCMGDYRWGFGLVNGFIDHMEMVTISNYNSITGLHTLEITVTAAHRKSSVSSLVIFW
jgi:hypothetical protein